MVVSYVPVYRYRYRYIVFEQACNFKRNSTGLNLSTSTMVRDSEYAESIAVSVRVRPLLPQELWSSKEDCVQVTEQAQKIDSFHTVSFPWFGLCYLSRSRREAASYAKAFQTIFLKSDVLIVPFSSKCARWLASR
jgi:hypothetical protein